MLTTSQDWWPADFGHYGPLIIRMAWHSAGTYRISDGRGGAGAGQQRFAPLNSWPDNGNLDKARRLLWPVKQKYGRKLSWADLMVLAGNVALESMGFKTFGFGGGRADVWEPDEDVYWGPETDLARRRALHRRPRAREPARRRPDGPDLRQPGGPERQPRPARRGPRHPRDVRPHGDERRGDRRADRRRPHLRQDPRRGRPRTYVGPEPEAAPLEEQGLGWKNSFGTGKGGDAITSGLEVTWTPNADHVGQQLLREPVRLRVGADARARPARTSGCRRTRRGGHRARRRTTRRSATPPTMLTTDLSLRFDPVYEPISRRFHENPDEFADAFARAWFKLTHRDMGPVARYLGPEVPGRDADLAGPGPRRRPRARRRRRTSPRSRPDPRLGPVGRPARVARPGRRPRRSAAATSAAAPTARASASRRRSGWEVNDPAELATVLRTLEGIQAGLQRRPGRAASRSRSPT